MKKTIVYKITRVDGLDYIGITINFKSRMYAHRKSDRFKMGISNIEILEECGSYQDAETKEVFYIQLYDTYKNGLNVTSDGKGLNEGAKFNTLGFVFSDSTRKKMSDSAKKRGHHGVKKHTDETKRIISDMKKDKPNYPSQKITDSDVDDMVRSYNESLLRFEIDYLKTLVKASQREIVTIDNIYDMVGKGGNPITPVVLYCHYYAKLYNVTPACIRGYILGTKSRIKQTVKSVGPKRVG